MSSTSAVDFDWKAQVLSRVTKNDIPLNLKYLKTGTKTKTHDLLFPEVDSFRVLCSLSRVAVAASFSN